MPTYNTTTRLAIRKPQANQKVNDFTPIVDALADDADAKTVGWLTGTLAGRPAAGVAGRVYKATDGNALTYLDTGSAWQIVSVTSAWVNLTPAANYAVTATGAYTGAARLVGDTVELCGVVVDTIGGHTNWNQIATIPAGLRPAQSVGGTATAIAWAAGATGGSWTNGDWFVTPAGALSYAGTTGSNYAVMLDGLSYRLV